MLPFIFAFAAVASGARVQRRQDDCSSTTTLDALTVTRVEPISIYILPGQLAPTGTGNNDPFTAVYTTVYPTFCPDCSQGLKPQTYTVTQTCTDSIASCQPSGDQLPAGFTTTQATCTDCPTPFSAVLTVPQATDAVFTSTYIEVVTAPDLTTTRTVVRTCASEPCLPQITGYTGRISTIDAGLFAEPVTATATVTKTEERTATVTSEPSAGFRPGNFNSGAGRLVSSDRSLVLGVSTFVLLLLASS
ncbi:hypothetical protein ColTof4_13902 [Colletotrichum tofieldiae]|uniref:Uncharacterized protein n=1 Tax=Colletotrichum tofieldiae TaxID=708197 RepID=A0A166PAY0_9PEZI|nr:hypothetical protein CT0861_09422 [Colletotrichum tofieldiae]GKT56120.1 hypothetical protein ColTof3_03459 [Colletotrichum tofieldiae]GKT81479.1 hypothetical protein ColTof4_13902 [Colletotrichum tofieldiae]